MHDSNAWNFLLSATHDMSPGVRLVWLSCVSCGPQVRANFPTTGRFHGGVCFSPNSRIPQECMRYGDVQVNWLFQLETLINRSCRAVRQVIADITKRMGAGMADFVSLDLGQGTTSTADYNKYCHFVAGLVGDGLTRLFAATGVEGPEILNASDLANRCSLVSHSADCDSFKGTRTTRCC